ncbi:MAG: Qat anti-phage system QueC-like protein QatC [Thermodesulfobacteriota bacterium]|nr:Qat anti-phage system QueC-like protein QatC [Thermodesulfobacteriota bacterium]
MNVIHIVCKLNENDSFQISPKALYINLSNKKDYHYTFWNVDRNHNEKLKLLPNFFSEEGLDLLYLSLFVYYADRRIKREMFPDAWTRNFKLYIPVLSLNKWKSQKELLEKLLSFLSGDVWTIIFRKRQFNKIENDFIEKQRKAKGDKIISNIFSMLSGGFDSFIGAIDLLEKQNNIIFINHYGGGPSGSIFINSVKESLNKKYGNSKEYNVFKFHAAVKKGTEDTTRTRSFMFFAHAIALATTMNDKVKLYIPENGLISLNIPLTNSRLGSSSTRTTHPYYMEKLQELLNNLNIAVILKNPYQFKTKGEMILDCQNISFLKDNCENTISCSHPDVGRYRKESEPSHCGICYPCVIRRAAFMKANIIDSSLYRDLKFTSGDTAKNNFSVYKIGLLKYKKQLLNTYSQIQISGELNTDIEQYKSLYERGMQELSDFIESI